MKQMTCDEVNDLPTIYGDGTGLSFGSGAYFQVTCDPDSEHPEVNLHAHKSGIGGLFPMTTKSARELGLRLIQAADVTDQAT